MSHFLDFEKPIAELEGRVEELRRSSAAGGIDVADEVGKLSDKDNTARNRGEVKS